MTLIKDKVTGEWVQTAGGHRMWMGTRAQLNDDISSGDIPSDAVITAIVTDEPSIGYVQNGTYNKIGGLVMPVPDWSNAVTVSKAQLGAGYAVPKNGIIVGTFRVNENTETYMAINGINVANAFLVTPDSWSGQVQCPVGAGDLVKVLQAAGTGQYTTSISFVPWKE